MLKVECVGYSELPKKKTTEQSLKIKL